MDVRTCERRDEVAGAIGAINHYFDGTVSDQWMDWWLTNFEIPRMHAAFDDGRIVAGAGAFPFELTVPGGTVPAAGVTAVGVLPTHRRRGIMRAMMRTQLDDVHARDEPVAILFASEETIYGRYGYGVASLHASIEIPRNRSSFARPVQARGRTRLVDTEEALELFPPVYDTVRRERPGAFARSRTWWESRLLADQEWRRRGGAALQRVVLEHDGRPEGYALYRLQQSIEHGTSTGQVRVIEAVGATPRAENEIWRLLLDIDWIDRVTAWLLPADHPLLLLLAEPRRAAFRLGDGLWLRVVDVEAAFAARSYAGDEAVVIDVRDAFCPWNEGRWRIGPEGAKRTDAEPTLRLDASDLASLYLGGFTLGQLARVGRVEELAGGAIEAGHRLLYTERAPWCPEIF